jgi:hypothetical protein
MSLSAVRIYPQTELWQEQLNEMQMAARNGAHRTPMRALVPCRIFNLIRDHQRDIRFMRHPTDVHSEEIMRFFTPELYLRYNSSDDEVADLADSEWENALEQYKHYLDSIRDRMPLNVRQLAELCLHDAEVLGFQKEIQSAFPFAEPFRPGWSVVSIVSLKQAQSVKTLFYFLWDRIREYPANQDWQFSKLGRHWLYDEVDIAQDNRGMFLHRVLFSDGSVVEIPFVSAIASDVNLPEKAA